jgi:repressor LexA
MVVSFVVSFDLSHKSVQWFKRLQHEGICMLLSQVQKKIYLYFETMIRDHGHIPTLRQAAADNGVSHAAIAQTIRVLEKKGYVRRDSRYGRQIQLIKKTLDSEDDHGYLRVPVVGSIAAGLPLYAQKEWMGSLKVDPLLFKNGPLFALKVNGDSMKGAGILDGDFVICEPRQYAANGEIVAALICQEEATIKRFFLKSDGIELRPENPDFEPVTYGFGEVLVQGKVVGLVRVWPSG